MQPVPKQLLLTGMRYCSPPTTSATIKSRHSSIRRDKCIKIVPPIYIVPNVSSNPANWQKLFRWIPLSLAVQASSHNFWNSMKKWGDNWFFLKVFHSFLKSITSILTHEQIYYSKWQHVSTPNMCIYAQNILKLIPRRILASEYANKFQAVCAVNNSSRMWSCQHIGIHTSANAFSLQAH